MALYKILVHQGEQVFSGKFSDTFTDSVSSSNAQIISGVITGEIEDEITVTLTGDVSGIVSGNFYYSDDIMPGRYFTVSGLCYGEGVGTGTATGRISGQIEGIISGEIETAATEDFEHTVGGTLTAKIPGISFLVDTETGKDWRTTQKEILKAKLLELYETDLKQRYIPVHVLNEEFDIEVETCPNETDLRHRVYFDSKGGFPPKFTKSVTAGQVLGSISDPYRKHFKFSGWFNNADEQIFPTFIPEKDTDLFAKWSSIYPAKEPPRLPDCSGISGADPLPYFTAYYDSRGGFPSKVTKKVISGHVLGSISDPYRKHFKFSGWFNNADEQIFPTHVMEENIDLFGTWYAVPPLCR